MRVLQRTGPGGKAAFTLVEVAVALGLASVTLGMVSLLTRASGDLARESMSQAKVEADLMSALGRVVQELRVSSLDSIDPVLDENGANFATDIEYLRVTSTDEDGGDFTAQARLWLDYDLRETDDGVDEDGDGLIDECRLLLTVTSDSGDEHTVTLMGGIAEYAPGEVGNGLDDDGDGFADERGLIFYRDGETIITSLTATVSTSVGTTLNWNREARLWMRNP